MTHASFLSLKMFLNSPSLECSLVVMAFKIRMFSFCLSYQIALLSNQIYHLKIITYQMRWESALKKKALVVGPGFSEVRRRRLQLPVPPPGLCPCAIMTSASFS